MKNYEKLKDCKHNSKSSYPVSGLVICNTCDKHLNEPQHAPTLERYEAVSQYINNQCPASWEHLVKFVLDAQPLIRRAVNAYEKDQETIRELVEALKRLANVTNTKGMNRSVVASIVEESWQAIAKAEAKS